MNAVAKTVEMVLRNNAWKATKYLSEKDVVRATRRTFHGKIVSRSNIEITLTLGRPNFAEREFIRACKRSGEPFPVKRVQLKFTPKKR